MHEIEIEMNKNFFENDIAQNRSAIHLVNYNILLSDIYIYKITIP